MIEQFLTGRIYKISDMDDNMVYIGSTRRPLVTRFTDHKQHYNMFTQGKRPHDCKSFDIFKEYGVEKCEIELLEEIQYTDITQLREREGYYIKIIPCVNRCIAGRNKQQYYLDNREDILAKNKIFAKNYRREHPEQVKEYREAHKERIKENKKAYYIKHKTAILQRHAAYTASHKEQIKDNKKAYYIKHRSAILRQKAAYYVAHKEQREACLANHKEIT